MHVSLMKVTPTSGKGTLGTWRFLRQARVRLDKTGLTAVRARDEGMSKPVEGGAYVHQCLNFVANGKAHS